MFECAEIFRQFRLYPGRVVSGGKPGTQFLVGMHGKQFVDEIEAGVVDAREIDLHPLVPVQLLRLDYATSLLPGLENPGTIVIGQPYDFGSMWTHGGASKVISEMFKN